MKKGVDLLVEARQQHTPRWGPDGKGKLWKCAGATPPRGGVL